MRVTDLARRADTTTETVRHYTDLGLLAPRRNSHNGYREYGAEDLRRLRFALKARSLGFTLSDVSELMSASGAGQTPCPRVRDLIETRLGGRAHPGIAGAESAYAPGNGGLGKHAGSPFSRRPGMRADRFLRADWRGGGACRP